MPAVRRAVRTTAGGLTLVLLAACTGGGGDDTPDPDPTRTPTTSASAEPLELAVFGTDEQVAAYEDVARAYTASPGGVEVEVTSYPDAASAVTAVTQGSADGDDLPDVFLLDSAYLTQVAQEGMLQPLDELLEERDLAFGDDYQRVALTELSYDASLQCMPAEMSPLVLYAASDLLPPTRRLRNLGVVLPRGVDTWSWGEMVATARAIAVSDADGPVRGVSLPPDTELVTALVRSAGDDIVDDVFEPTSVDLTSDEDQRVLSQLAVLLADDSVAPSPRELQRRSAVDRFVDGELGMFLGTRADLPALRAAEVPFQVLPLPNFSRGRSVSTVTGYCVPAASPAVEEAADFIAWAVGPDGSAVAAQSGVLVPSRLDVLSAQAFTQPGKLPTNYRVYADMVRRSEPMPFAAEWPALVQRTDRLLARVLTDPTFDIGVALPRRMQQYLRQTERVLAPEETRSPTPTESPEPTGTAGG